jgi:hypothetical protein
MNNNQIIRALIIAVAIVLTAFILKSAIKNRNAAQDTISVTGLGTVDFVSDEISWSGSFDVLAADAKTAYNTLVADKEKVKNFFITKGFKENEFSFGGVEVNKDYKNISVETSNGGIRYESVFNGYVATQTIYFSAKKNEALMAKIEKVKQETAELINLGIEFTSYETQYTYSDLPSLKHNLIESATKDARERASKIVKSGKGSLGKLQGASMGVFQITGKDSNEEFSYGGVFDTYHKEKSARITVRLTYVLD